MTQITSNKKLTRYKIWYIVKTCVSVANAASALVAQSKIY